MMRTYDSYKDSEIEWIGEIPRHWESSKLKYDVLLVMGQSPDSDNYIDIDNGNPFLQGNTEFGLTYPSNNKWTKQVTKMTKIGDLLYSVRGSLGEMNWSDKEYCIGRGLCGIRPIYLDKKYTFYLFLTLKEEIKSIGVGSTFLSISTDDLKNLFYFKPPLTEQEQIVSYLDEKTSLIDEMVEKKKRKIELLKEYRTSLINTVVTKGLNPDVPMKDSGIEWIGEIPRHWVVGRLKHLLIEKPDNGLFKRKEEFGNGVKFVNVSNLFNYNNKVDVESLERVSVSNIELDKSGLEDGDIFFVRSSLKLEGIGVSSIVDRVEEPIVFDCHIIRIKSDKSKIVPNYLISLLNSQSYRTYLISVSETVTMTTISQDKIKDMVFYYPPLPEQEQIVSYLDEKTSEIDKIIELENKKIELLKEYRQSLISNVVTGKIKVVSE